MKIEEIKEALYDYIKEEFNIGDDPDFSTDINLFDYGFVDSFGASMIIMFIEKKFNIEITQKDIVLYPMNSIDEISEIVMSKNALQ